MNEKICTKCKLLKPFSEYHKGNDKFGYDYRCKGCSHKTWSNVPIEERRKRNRLRSKKKTSDYLHECYVRERKKNPRKFILNHAKARAKAKDLDINIDIEDIVLSDICPILGIPMSFSEPVRGACGINKDNSYSLDRIEPNKGYVKGNVIVCSHRANVLKNNGSLEEHRKIVEFLEKWQRENEESIST